MYQLEFDGAAVLERRAATMALVEPVDVLGNGNVGGFPAFEVSGTPIKLSSFNTECFFGSGASLTENDVQKIDKIGVQVPSSEDTITLSSFCLTQIDLGK
jgi:hypothetical protein